MHHPLDPDALARVISSSLNMDGVEYRYQEDCGSSNTSSFFKLVNSVDMHDTIVVSVATLVVLDRFDEDLLQRGFDQNIAFLQDSIGVKLALCPSVLASGKPSLEFGFSWVAYRHIDGWPLSSYWHQLQPDIRKVVVENIASFTTELASIPPNFKKDAAVTTDYVGSLVEPRILYSHSLMKDVDYRVSQRDMSAISSHGKLVKQLAKMHCFKLQQAAGSPGYKLLAVDQVRAISPVAEIVLDQPYSNVLAHLNLDPQNIWIDPFTGKLTAILGWELAHFAPTWMASAPPLWLINERHELMLQSEKRGDPWKIWRPHFHHASKNIGKEMTILRQIWDNTIHSGGSSSVFKNTWAQDSLARLATKVSFVEGDKLVKSLHWAEQVISPISSPPLHISFLWLSVILMAIIPGEAILYTVFGGTLSLGKMILGIFMTTICFFVLVAMARFPSPEFTQVTRIVIKVDRKTAAKYLLAIEATLFKTRFSWMFGYAPSNVDEKPALEAVPCSPASSLMPTGIYVPNLMSRAPTAAAAGRP